MESLQTENMTSIALPNSIQKIIQNIQNLSEFSIGKIKNIVREAQVTKEDLMPWSDFEHPGADSYGRKMLYDGGWFEIMVMSWQPGDMSGIHDHGYAQWGAVQIFGPAEHAVFLAQDGEIRTLSRNVMKPGQIVGVGHELVHQMGNKTDGQFLTLHVYGNPDRKSDVTADARIFDLDEGTVRITTGGAFFALPESDISKRINAPESNYLTWLRDHVEIIRRVKKGQKDGTDKSEKDLNRLIDKTFSKEKIESFKTELSEQLDENNKAEDSIFWKLLNWELKEAAQLQRELEKQESTRDHFQNYAELYDAIIGKPCFDGFIKNYIQFVKDTYQLNFSDQKLISIGCGTGLMEQFIIEQLEMPYDNLYGMDLSEGMVQVAKTRIHADVGDALELDPSIKTWDLTFCGLNVFQYVDHQYLFDVIRKTAEITKDGGYFFGDFITTDHIRWYPNVIQSEDKKVISLRTPELIEKDNHMYQKSSIINLNFMQDKTRITYEGEHERFLPPMTRVRTYFEEAFKGQVDVYDAISLQKIQENEDTCPSTRYLVVAQKRT